MPGNTVGNNPVLRDHVAALFERQASPRPNAAIGAELELIPIRSQSHARAGIATSADGIGTADIVRDAARDRGWIETTDSYDTPAWELGDGGRICYEPGGQYEIVSPVFEAPDKLAQFIATNVAILRDAAHAAGVTLLATGVDPYNSLESVAVEMRAPRYDAMARYFDSIGQSGSRMMRQSASLHVSVELGPDVMQRWRLLNALAPYLVAAFANSATYAGHSTDYRSYRSRLWQTLDPSRTGLPFDAADPIGAYFRFAAGAGRIVDDDTEHLTTLFPEVRPRGYFEIRSIDSLEPDGVADALHFISGLINDRDVAAEAVRIVGDPDSALLARAAALGTADPFIRDRVVILERLARGI